MKWHICSFWKWSQRVLKSVGVCSHEKWRSRFLAVAKNLWVVQRYWVNGGCWGDTGLGFLRLCILAGEVLRMCKYSYEAWSSFLYIPYSYQYIQQIERRVRNWMEYFMLCLCSVWKHIVYYLSGHIYLYLKQLLLSVVYDHHRAINALV